MDLIFSDIHADIVALNSILSLSCSKDFQQKYGEINRILCLGDLLERGTQPRKVLQKMEDLTKNYSVISVMGNHDEAFLYGREVDGSSLESISAHSELTQNDLKFFHKNSDATYGIQEFLDKRESLLLVHGGPIEPKKIIPNILGQDTWLYQKSWQRLSDNNDEFFSYSGYHYSASSAFAEANTRIKNPIILCGHQHIEAAIKQGKQGISEVLSSLSSTIEKFPDFVLEKKEIPIEAENNYLIRVGLGGSGVYSTNSSIIAQFAIMQYNPKKIILMTINK